MRGVPHPAGRAMTRPTRFAWLLLLLAPVAAAQPPVVRSGPRSLPPAPTAAPYVAPKGDGPVVELLDEIADPLIPLLTNTGGGEPGGAWREDRDVFAGLHALRVTPIQKYQPNLPGWAYRIAERPAGAGEFRYVRFAWKKSGGTGLMIQFHDEKRSWVARYVAGPNTVGWQAIPVADKAPAEWAVVTRDLFKDYGPLTISGVAFTPMDGEAGLFDHVLLGRTVADLDRATDAALGRVPPKAPPADGERAALWRDLAERTGEKPTAALRAFLASAPESVGFIRRQLADRPADDPARRVGRLIADLDDDRFAVREAATAELKRIGTPAVAALQEAVKTTGSPEVKYRAEAILRALAAKPGEVPPAAVLAARVVRVLERAATPDARKLLAEMARGEFEAEYVPAAGAALRRLGGAAPR